MEKKFDLKEVLDLSPEKIREFIGLGKENFELYQKPTDVRYSVCVGEFHDFQSDKIR